jgi:hypothetical protein
MIILFHGTGDDDSKVDNWMRWVADIMRPETPVLTVNGVASKLGGVEGPSFMSRFQSGPAALSVQARNHQEAVNSFFGSMHLHRAKGTGGLGATRIMPPPTATPRADLAGLTAALAACGTKDFTSTIPSGQEQQVALDTIKKMRGETFASAIGIKPRMTYAAACALAYYRAGGSHPIRIIGHSRGGSTAIGTHNLLTYYGVPCEYTLSLDPCHGMNAEVLHLWLSHNQKEYYTKIWGGTVTNIGATKGVGADWAGRNYLGSEPNRAFALDGTRRPDITLGAGCLDSARVYNLDKRLKEVKHGHMGKFTHKKRIIGTGAGQVESLDAMAREIREFFKMCIGLPRADLLRAFFVQSTFDAEASDAADKRFVQQHVMATLTATRGGADGFTESGSSQLVASAP